MQDPFDRAGTGPVGAGIEAREVVGQLRLDRAPHQKIAAEAEKHGFRAGGGALPAPLVLDAEEAGDEGAEGPRRVHQQPGPPQGVEGVRIGPVGREAGMEPRLLGAEPLEEGGVELGEAVLAVEILIREAGNAEREVPLGGRRGWSRRQGKGIVAEGRRSPDARSRQSLTACRETRNNENRY